MSKPQLQGAIALVINDHAPWIDPKLDLVECCCGASFPYMSRWSAHVAEAVVSNVFGGGL